MVAICSVVARLEGIFLYAATAVRIAKYATAPTKVTVITRNPNTTVAVTHSIMSGSDCHTAASPETAALTPIHPPTALKVSSCGLDQCPNFGEHLVDVFFHLVSLSSHLIVFEAGDDLSEETFLISTSNQDMSVFSDNVSYGVDGCNHL